MSVKKFKISIFFIFLTFIYIVGTLSASNDSKTNKIKEATMLTKLPGVSLSTSFIENRIIYYDDCENRFYLNMQSYNYMDFIYAKQK